MRVPAVRLHERRVVLADGETSTWTLLPLFDRCGLVHHVLLVEKNQPELYLVPVERLGITRFPRFLAPRLALARRDLAEPSSDATDLLALERNSWHWDPWWLLATPERSNHPASPRLKATNAVPPLVSAKVDTLSFSPDLRRVTGYGRTRDGATHWKRWSPELLPAAKPGKRDTTKRHRRVWSLRPNWLGPEWSSP